MNLIFDMPKVDLHCHLDGSISMVTIKKLAKLQNITLPQEEPQIRKSLQVSDECNSLADYLHCFELPLACLVTEESFYLSAYHLLEAAEKEHVMYMELRFAPLLSTKDGLRAEQIIESVLNGMKAAERDFGIKSNLILCCMRHHTEEQNLKVVKLAKIYLEKGVCALDLAGDEAAYPAKLFAPIFKTAGASGIPFTFHAGECGSEENVKEAIALGAKRLGHGIAIKGNKELQSLCVQKKIGIELCPVSNVQTKAIKNMKVYPIEEFIEAQMLVTVNTDNRMVSDTSMCNEFEILKMYFDIDMIEITRNSICVSFADKETKHWMEEKLNHWVLLSHSMK